MTERELARHGVRVGRETLVSHYLVLGQLRTLVAQLTASTPRPEVHEAVAAALLAGPDESANPRFVAPLASGLVFGGLVLAAVAVLGGIRLGGAMRYLDPVWLLVIGGTLVSLCLAYTFLGARIGRVRANRILGLTLWMAM